MIINKTTKFGEGGRIDNDRFESAFRETMDEDGYCALHGIMERAVIALTAASENPATMTINDFVTFLETEANVLKVIAEW